MLKQPYVEMGVNNTRCNININSFGVKMTPSVVLGNSGCICFSFEN